MWIIVVYSHIWKWLKLGWIKQMYKFSRKTTFFHNLLVSWQNQCHIFSHKLHYSLNIWEPDTHHFLRTPFFDGLRGFSGETAAKTWLLLATFIHIYPTFLLIFDIVINSWEGVRQMTFIWKCLVKICGPAVKYYG